MLPKVSTGACSSSTCASTKNFTKSSFYTQYNKHKHIKYDVNTICLPVHADVGTHPAFLEQTMQPQVPPASLRTSSTGG